VTFGIPARFRPRRPGRWWALLLVAGCAAQGSSGTGSPAAAPSDDRSPADSSEIARRIDGVANEYFAAWVQAFPIDALFSGVPEAPNDRLNDNSLAAVRAWQGREDSWLAQLQSIDVDQVRGSPEEVTYGVVRETLEASQQTRVCRNELLPLSQQGGFQIYLPVLSQLQPVGTATLRAEALARWRAMVPYIDTEITTLREGVRQGYTQPRLNAREVLEQLDDILRIPPGQSPFAGIADRDSTPGFRDSVVAIVAREILPAVRRYRDYVASDYLSHARETTALSALSHGADCYRALVRRYTTLDLEPRVLYQLGLKQMAAIEAEMLPIAKRSFGTSDLPALMERLRSDSQYTFRSREELIRTAELAVARAKAALPRWFGHLPKEDLLVDPCLPFEEKSGCPNSYVSGTPDGSRPGRWRINAGVPQPRAPLEGTAFHETIPGHHLQGAIAQERTGDSPITRYFGFSGYWEGWALYAEHLALEMGIYSSDLYRLGEFGEQALRAARLVVDPGLSVLDWTRQQAIDYMVVRLPYSRTVVESEVDRYIAGPGQATSYMVGRLEIERLRADAESRLGKGFDIRAFHDQVLENGAVPLPLLRSHVEAWLHSRTHSAGGH
jgi:uncharacterized protein (DUF885 family)